MEIPLPPLIRAGLRSLDGVSDPLYVQGFRDAEMLMHEGALRLASGPRVRPRVAR